MDGWGITNTIGNEVRDAGEIVAVLDAIDKIDNQNTSMYWTAPDTYLGNQVIYFVFVDYIVTCGMSCIHNMIVINSVICT